MPAAVVVEDISKRYTLGSGAGYRRLTEVFADRLRPARRGPKESREFWALTDVSFEVAEGEVIGIIGRNGAGKSTLLKILSRITEPTSGRAVLEGRVGSLLEVGTGFHPELTGRENIFLNGAVLGMRKAEIARRFDEIVAFAEIDRFLDTPVKRYSSGMYVRLAFAVAAHLNPEILVVDEVLAVGDAAFQKKCIGKMSDVAASGRTVLFVSHNMSAVRSLCDRAILLNAGRIVTDSSVHAAVDLYLASPPDTSPRDLRARVERGGEGPVRVVALRISSFEGGPPRTGEILVAEIDYESSRPSSHTRFQVGVYDLSNTGIYLMDSDVSGGLPSRLPTTGTVRCSLGPVHITSGRCFANVAVHVANGLSDHVEHAQIFDVETSDPWGHGHSPPREWAICDAPQIWKVDPQ